jgi:hypothetical protein
MAFQYFKRSVLYVDRRTKHGQGRQTRRGDKTEDDQADTTTEGKRKRDNEKEEEIEKKR